MIRRTFQLIRGIGPSRERTLWTEGITSWDALVACDDTPLSEKERRAAIEKLSEARGALEARELSTLGRLLPPREHWRLYREFGDEAVFFDIETDGRQQMAPTVVSLFHRGGFDVFIQGRNLDALPAALGRHRLWVTFNGSVFDVPVLRAWFGKDFPDPELHLDLRFVCRRLGLKGGLKSLEDALGFSRPPHLRGVNGMDAVLLWRAFKHTADIAALRFLVEYTLYDSIQLRTLAETLYNRGVEASGLDAPRLSVFERGDVLYDVTRYLLSLAPQGDELALLRRLRARDRNLQEL